MHQAPNERSNKNGVLHQWLAASGALLYLILVEFTIVWPSPYIALLTSSSSPFPVTLEEASWVASLLNLGKFPGAIGGCVCLNYFGSKTTTLINCVPMAICWLFTILADNVKWLYAARFVSGFTYGATFCCYSQYIAEIADPSNRGTLFALSSVGVPIGDTVMCIMGAYLDMRTSATLSLFLCVVAIVIFICLPESPHHLVKKNLDEKAKSSIQWYHRNCDVETEIMKLKKFVQDDSTASLSNTLKKFKSAVFSKSMFLIIVLSSYSQFCGQNSVFLYMESLLTFAEVSVLAPALIVVIAMSFSIVGPISMMFMMDRYGRKACLCLSSTGVVVTCILLTTEFQLLGFGFDPKKIQGVLIVAVILGIVSSDAGLIGIPFLLLGELFPPHLKGVAACFTSCVIGIFSFIVSRTYMPLVNLMTHRYVYVLYGTIIMTAVPFIIFFVPETKGLTLQEIQNTNKSQCTDVEENSQKQNGSVYSI